MNTQNITSNSTERWTTARLIRPNGIVEIYSNYMVSDQGRICSLVDNHGNVRKDMKILKPGIGSTGYLVVCLCLGSKHCTRTLHRIILSSFDQAGWFPGCEADHANRDRTDCRLVNLKWITKNDNKANRSRGALKPIKVTYLNDSRTRLFDNMYDCDRAFGMYLGWCSNIVHKHNGFNAKYNILIEKI